MDVYSKVKRQSSSTATSAVHPAVTCMNESCHTMAFSIASTVKHIALWIFISHFLSRTSITVNLTCIYSCNVQPVSVLQRQEFLSRRLFQVGCQPPITAEAGGCHEQILLRRFRDRRAVRHTFEYHGRGFEKVCCGRCGVVFGWTRQSDTRLRALFAAGLLECAVESRGRRYSRLRPYRAS